MLLHPSSRSICQQSHAAIMVVVVQLMAHLLNCDVTAAHRICSC